MFRYRLITTLMVILVFCAIAMLGSGVAFMKTSGQEAYNLHNLIRLHILANSDLPVDQSLKLKVRDRVIRVTEPLLIRVEDPQKAEEIVIRNLARIEAAAERELIRQGQPMPVKAQFGQFQFPQRVYPFGVLPAGEYRGIRITLGKGAGRNWWCILYPPLCLLNPDAPSFKKAMVARNSRIEYRLAALEKLVRQKNLSMDRFWERWGRTFGMF